MGNNGEKHIELSVELAHDLRDGEDDNLLVINHGDHHQIFEKIEDAQQAHTITWTLTGNASSGEFCALDEPDNPGFLWLVRTPSERVFPTPQLLEKNKLIIHNHHHDKTSEGVWHYQLFVRFGGKVCGVPLTFCCGGTGMTSPNPSIKNT